MALNPDPRRSDSFWRILIADRIDGAAGGLSSPPPDEYAKFFKTILFRGERPLRYIQNHEDQKETWGISTLQNARPSKTPAELASDLMSTNPLEAALLKNGAETVFRHRAGLDGPCFERSLPY